jgi:tetratricopeptide (TPR) repeat protein
MSRRTILTSVLLLVSYHLIQGQDYQYFYNEAKTALSEKRYQEFYSSIKKAHELHPYHQTILWYAGVAAALNNRPDESIALLTKAININAGYDLDDPNLNSIRMLAEFQKLVQTKQELLQTQIRSDTVNTFQDRQLHLESVAFDPFDKTLYGGSIQKRKIVKVDRRGIVSDFTREEQYGMGGVFGLRVDINKSMLWACSSPIPEMQNYDSTLVSALFQFDIKTGALVQSYKPQDTLTNHVFGDLVLDSKGTPFVSDSRNNVIYRYDGKQLKLVPYFSSKEFWSIQGLAFSEGDKYLYISDYVKGVFLLDIQTMKLSKVDAPYDLSLKGTDGLLFYKNSLITIQNGVQPNRVVRHFLNTSGISFTRYEVIDNAHPAFGEPTIGTIREDTLMYVANSQWNGYQDGKIKPSAELHPIVILKYDFEKK